MKKIFILTGEPSGDKLASKVIAHLKNSRSDIEYLSVGGEYLKSLGVDPDRRIDKTQFRAYGNWWEINYKTDNPQQKQSVKEEKAVPNLGNGATKPARNWRLEESRNFTVAPAYNKGAYQVITKSNIKDIGK